MTYVEKNVVNNNEKIVLRVEKSKLSLVGAWIWGILGSILFFIPTIIAIKKTLTFGTTEFVVTDKKAIEKYGIVQIHVDEMDLAKIENITFSIPFWGRVFNYSDLCIQGTNNNNIRFSNIKNGNEVKKVISDLSAKAKGL